MSPSMYTENHTLIFTLKATLLANLSRVSVPSSNLEEMELSNYYISDVTMKCDALMDKQMDRLEHLEMDFC